MARVSPGPFGRAHVLVLRAPHEGRGRRVQPDLHGDRAGADRGPAGRAAAGVAARAAAGAEAPAPARLHDARRRLRVADPAGPRAAAHDLRARRRDRGVHAAHDGSDRSAADARARDVAVLGRGRGRHRDPRRLRALTRRRRRRGPRGRRARRRRGASWCYVEGASVTRSMPGWQVISWVVALALPITLPASCALLWWSGSGVHAPTASEWTCLVPRPAGACLRWRRRSELAVAGVSARDEPGAA